MGSHNHFTFGLGTIGRDMVYTLISMYLIFYLTDVIHISTEVLWWVTGIMLVGRIFDACNDPIMGVIVDNTHSRFGKFKPWIAIGAAASGLVTVLLFADFALSDTRFVILFAVLYLLWGISYTANDIGYWSMLPSLSLEQPEREKIGSFARICANVGLFFVVAGIVPITTAWGDALGSLSKAYFYFSAMVVALMWIGQCITLFGVKEKKFSAGTESHTPLRALFRIIYKNDQLFYVAIAMALFMIGYTTTTAFGLYYFKYIFGDENRYPLFALILGISQITALAFFPIFSRRFKRSTLFSAAIVLIITGYILFFFAPNHTMSVIGAAGILLFVGQAFIQLLMLMFLADTVDYGHWKLGKRNESVTFSLQPFINKMGGAAASGVVGVVVIISGIKEAQSAAAMTAGGVLIVKTAMMIFPLLCVLASYAIYRAKYKIDDRMYARIQSDLRARGEIADGDEKMKA